MAAELDVRTSVELTSSALPVAKASLFFSSRQRVPFSPQGHQAGQIHHVVEIALARRNAVGHQDLGNRAPAGEHDGRVERVVDVGGLGGGLQLLARRGTGGKAEVIAGRVVAAGNGARAGLFHRDGEAARGQRLLHPRVGEEGLLLGADQPAQRHRAGVFDLRGGRSLGHLVSR
jgi:hypothetical protein